MKLPCAHFSVSSVECLGQFGKVVVDGVVLQSSAISSKTLVQRNGIPLVMGGREGGEEGWREEEGGGGRKKKEEREEQRKEQERRK